MDTIKRQVAEAVREALQTKVAASLSRFWGLGSVRVSEFSDGSILRTEVRVQANGGARYFMVQVREIT